MVETPRWPRRILSGAAAVFTAGSVTAGLATAFGAYSARQFGLRYETLPLLTPGQQPLRLLHISDIHLVAGDQAKIRFVQELAELAPDVIVNTGDNPGAVDAVEDVLEALAPLLQVPGIFVLGSNDFYAPRTGNPLRYLRAPTTRDGYDAEDNQHNIDFRRLVAGLSRTGQWQSAGNQARTLSIREDVRFNVAGTHDAHLRADRWPGFLPLATPTTYNIAVTHAPYRRVLDAAVADGAAIVFAGHTHGGQVALPGYGAIVSNCDLPTGLASGLFAWRSAGRRALVNVSAGIGVSPTVPLRTFCRPEAVVLDLIAPDHTAAPAS